MNPKIQAEIDKAAKDYEITDYTTYQCFKDGAQFGFQFGFQLATKMHEKLITALEVYAMTNETFPEYGDVAREALTQLREKLGEK